MNNINYFNVVEMKNENINLINYFLASSETMFTTKIINVLSLFLIDKSNAHKMIMKSDDNKTLSSLFDRCEESLSFDKNTLEYFFNLSLTYRIEASLNKKIAMKLAMMYNDRESSPLLKINMEIFKKIIDEIK